MRGQKQVVLRSFRCTTQRSQTFSMQISDGYGIVAMMQPKHIVPGSEDGVFAYSPQNTLAQCRVMNAGFKLFGRFLDIGNGVHFV
jgi:hypothetical protein